MSTSLTDTFNSLGLATTSSSSSSSSGTTQKQSLGQSDFLKLLTTQLTHQDPTKPMDNGAFMGQMAQFSTVSGIQDLQKSFADFASSMSSSQALQAASLVGKSVIAPSSQALLNAGGNVVGNFDLSSSSTNVKVTITDPKTGGTVKEIDLGTQGVGNVAFNWDGKDASGALSSPGVYNVQASAMIDGTNTALTTNIESQVESVTMANGSTGLQVNLVGLGPVAFNQVKQIL